MDVSEWLVERWGEYKSMPIAYLPFDHRPDIHIIFFSFFFFFFLFVDVVVFLAVVCINARKSILSPLQGEKSLGRKPIASHRKESNSCRNDETLPPYYMSNARVWDYSEQNARGVNYSSLRVTDHYFNLFSYIYRNTNATEHGQGKDLSITRTQPVISVFQHIIWWPSVESLRKLPSSENFFVVTLSHDMSDNSRLKFTLMYSSKTTNFLLVPVIFIANTQSPIISRYIIHSVTRLRIAYRREELAEAAKRSVRQRERPLSAEQSIYENCTCITILGFWLE